MIPVLIDFPVWFLFPWLFALGAVIGSFLNVCIYRIPVHDSLWDQLKGLADRPSHCPKCGTNIRWHDNIPVFGWLKLGGRCRSCRIRISPRYPLVEALNGALWVVVYYLEIPLGYGRTLEDSSLFTLLGPETFPGMGGMSPVLFLHLRYLYHMILIEALLVATFIDFDLRIIPDASTVPAMIVGVLASWGLGRLHLLPVWFQSPNLWQSFGLFLPEWAQPLVDGPAVPAWVSAHPHLHGLAVSLAGLVAGGGLVWLVRIIGGMALQQEAMGFGDVILMALIGSYLGWQATIIAFFLGAVCGSLVSIFVWLDSLIRWTNPDRYIPFGPYLSLGALLTLLGWKRIFPAFEFYFELGVLLLPMAMVVFVLFGVSLAALQGVKWMLGIRVGPEEPDPVWTAADQNAFFAGELVNRHTCRWPTRDWEGAASGRGQFHEERWRRGADPRSPFGRGGFLDRPGK